MGFPVLIMARSLEPGTRRIHRAQKTPNRVTEISGKGDGEGGDLRGG